MFKSAVNIFLFLCAITIMLVIGEGIVRTFAFLPKKTPKKTQGAIIPERTWIEYHPVLGWFNIRNARAVLQKSQQEIPVATNSIGLRGIREYPLSKKDGTFRIAALGDSFTFGFGVKDQETFSYDLEQKNTGWEVLNFGFAGYGIDQMYLLQDPLIFSYQPDVILLAVYPEDFWRAQRSFTDAGYAKPYFVLGPNGELTLHHVPVPKEKNFSVEQFPKIIQKGVVMDVLGKSRLFLLAERTFGKIRKELGWEDPDTSEDWLLGRAILKQMVAEVRAHHARPVFMIVPPLRWITGTDEPVRQSLLRFAKRESVEIIDLTPLFRKAARDSDVYRYYIKDDDHWTPEGHRLVAAIVKDYLEADSSTQRRGVAAR